MPKIHEIVRYGSVYFTMWQHEPSFYSCGDVWQRVGFWSEAWQLLEGLPELEPLGNSDQEDNRKKKHG